MYHLLFYLQTIKDACWHLIWGCPTETDDPKTVSEINVLKVEPKNKFTMDRLFIAVLFLASASPWAGVRSLRGVGQKADGSKVILWDVENPIFRIDNTENVMDVRLHQQVHIICPEEKDQK